MVTWRDRLSANVGRSENGTDDVEDDCELFMPRLCPCDRRSGLSARYMKLHLCSDGALCVWIRCLMVSAVWVRLAFSRPSVMITAVTFFSLPNRWNACPIASWRAVKPWYGL